MPTLPYSQMHKVLCWERFSYSHLARTSDPILDGAPKADAELKLNEPNFGVDPNGIILMSNEKLEKEKQVPTIPVKAF